MVSLISDFESHLRNQVSSFSASKQHSISKNHRVNILQAEKSQSVLFEYENYVDTLSRTNKLFHKQRYLTNLLSLLTLQRICIKLQKSTFKNKSFHFFKRFSNILMQTVLKKGEYVSIFLILDENRKKSLIQA